MNIKGVWLEILKRWKNWLEPSSWKNGTVERWQNDKREHWVNVLGNEFVVYPGVFSPMYFEDSGFFAENIPVKRMMSMLEIGCGSGVVTIVAAKRGAGKLVAVDLSKEAVNNSKENVHLHKLDSKIEIRQSDVFEKVELREKFDLIFWNVPFFFTDNEDITLAKRALYDSGYFAIKKYIYGCRNYLNKGGRVLIGFSTTLGKVELLREYASDSGQKLKLLSRKKFHESGVSYEIFELLAKTDGDKITNHGKSKK